MTRVRRFRRTFGNNRRENATAPEGSACKKTFEIAADDKAVERGDRHQIHAARLIMAAHGRGHDKIALPLVRRDPYQDRGSEIEVPVVFPQHKLPLRTRQDRKERHGRETFGLGILPYPPRGLYSTQRNDSVAEAEQRLKPGWWVFQRLAR
ncbi:hypothetical protein Acry_3378 (plasmid) [Acidiphilium cryptum JF-5]|uniref:Uncharacterized protein n=1 Tax=Acidiphilium cryptum (strain JF-5) TaxID=349163 RepID=A5FTQ6_ACICJ|nr:hypothetical protein Acry_3378 [Acidiphilium cryptum JF-5]